MIAKIRAGTARYYAGLERIEIAALEEQFVKCIPPFKLSATLIVIPSGVQIWISNMNLYEIINDQRTSMFVCRYCDTVHESFVEKCTRCGETRRMEHLVEGAEGKDVKDIFKNCIKSSFL